MYAHPLAFYDVNDNLKELAGAIVRRDSPRGAHRFLVAVDGSPASIAAAEHARAEAGREGGDIRLLNVQPSPPARDARRTGERAMAGAMAVLDAAGASYRADVEFGDVAEAIARYAARERCTAIVLGDSGRNAVAKFLLGSTSYRVINRAEVPVTVVSRTVRAETYMPPLRWASNAR